MPLRTQNIQAIETHLYGCRFRSRLEARWAIFFETLGLPWEYEAEAYRLPDGDVYLPDFWLPTLNTWFEVKPPYRKQDATQTKAWRFMDHVARQSGPLNAAIAFGNIPDPTLGVIYQTDAVDAWMQNGFQIWHNHDNYHGWVICPTCGKIGITYDARNGYNCHHSTGKDWNPHHPKLLEAYRAARSARFEKPKPTRSRFDFGGRN